MNKSIIAALVVVAALIIGGVVVLGGDDDNSAPSTSTNTPSTNEQPQTMQPQSNQNHPTGQNVITYDGNGFSPSSLTVKSGSTVTIKSTSSDELELNSDPHPTHTDNPDLNVGSISPGDSRSFTLNQKGTFGYHNHLNPGQTGTITAE